MSSRTDVWGLNCNLRESQTDSWEMPKCFTDPIKKKFLEFFLSRNQTTNWTNPKLWNADVKQFDCDEQRWSIYFRHRFCFLFFAKNATTKKTCLGAYKPRVRCYDVNELSLKFERCFDYDCIRMKILSEDYSKVRRWKKENSSSSFLFRSDRFYARKSIHWISLSSRKLSHNPHAETRPRFRLSIFFVRSLLCRSDVRGIFSKTNIRFVHSF